LSFSYVAKTNVLYHLGINVGFADDLLENVVGEAVKGNCLQTSFSRLAQWGTDGQGDDNIIGMLLLTGVSGISKMYCKDYSVELRGLTWHLVGSCPG